MTREEEVLSNLTYAWVNWDYDDFIEKFFKHRFSMHADFHRDADSYAKENWTTFSENPARYMNHWQGIQSRVSRCVESNK